VTWLITLPPRACTFSLGQEYVSPGTEGALESSWRKVYDFRDWKFEGFQGQANVSIAGHRHHLRCLNRNAMIVQS